MNVNYLTLIALSFFLFALPGVSRDAAAEPPGSFQPVMAGLLGRPVFSPAAAPAPSPAPTVPAPADETLPFTLGGAPAPAARVAVRLGPVPAPIAVGELRDLVAPAVVALVASKPNGPAQVATGVLMTASGLILTSRRAIASALETGGKLAMVHAGPRGRFGSRELAEAVPARVPETSDE